MSSLSEVVRMAVPARAGTDAPMLAPAAHADAASPDGLGNAVRAVFLRDLRLALRQRGDTAAVLVFFVVVTSLFPLALGADAALLRRLAPGVVWVAALLASMLSLGRLFADDHQDGSLEQLLLSPAPLAALVAAKLAAHWLSSGLLLVVASPVIALQYDLGAESTALLALSLLLGTPLLSLLGGIGAALTVGVRGAGVLVSLLVLPLAAPVLIFGAGAVEAGSAGLGAGPQLSLLGALLAPTLFLAPIAVAAALRISLE